MYIKVRVKFLISLLIATSWFSFCAYLSLPWIYDLAEYITILPAILTVFSIALAPGFMYMFLLASYLFDKRINKPFHGDYPPITVLIPAYNEGDNICDTLNSLKKQDYPNELELILIDDGSNDLTIENATSLKIDNLTILKSRHQGKAQALNLGLKHSSYDHIVGIDADTYLLPNSIKEIVSKLLTGPKNTVACAGSVYVKNSRKNIWTKIQEWDYFHAIAVIKRSQSLLQGTLVAQGAFSIYMKHALEEIGGWDDVVGEDIVLTWGLLTRGHRIDFAENAISFTSVPENYHDYFFQRSRWARGMIEAFKKHLNVLIKPRLSTFYIYWNICFILLDTVFFFVFTPGVIAALFGYYLIAGPMTLAVIPLVVVNNIIFFVGQRKMFRDSRLRVRKNISGLIIYTLFYQFIINPAVIFGYVSELFNRKKSWGTK